MKALVNVCMFSISLHTQLDREVYFSILYRLNFFGLNYGRIYYKNLKKGGCENEER